MFDILSSSVEKLLKYSQYSFVIYAFAAGILISVCAALLGVILVLKHYSLIGHGLADVGFAALSAATVFGISPMLVSVPTVIIASFIIMAYSQKKGVAGDTALGIVAAASLAVGITLPAIQKGVNIDVYGYMFGSIIATNLTDVIISLCLAVVVAGLFILFYNRLFLITVDETFASASGINVTLYQFLISFLTALTVVVGMKMMGTLLISSLIIMPAVTAKKISRGFKSLVITASVISVICFILGMTASILFDIPPSAGIVSANVISMLLIGVAVRVKK